MGDVRGSPTRRPPRSHRSSLISLPSFAVVNPDRLTVKSQDALTESIGHARKNGNPQVHDTHLLYALTGQEEGIVVPILQKLGVGIPALRETLEREIAR